MTNTIVPEGSTGRDSVREVTRTAVVWCPDWPVVAHRRIATDAVAVMHGNRVVAASTGARRCGVMRGIRRRQAQQRCPELEIFDRDVALEVRAFESVVGALEALTPRVEIVRAGLVLFPTLGPSRYFGGDEAMAQRCVGVIGEVIGEFGEVRVGVADGAFAASLAARRATPDVLVVPPGSSATFLAPLPIRHLERPELSGVLARLGLSTLGSFAALSPNDVAGRFGAEGIIAHRLARGLDERPPAVADPPPDMEVVCELDPPVERVDQAAFLGKAIADEFLQRLEDRGATCTRIVISAETEHGEQLVRCWRNEGSLSAPAVADRVRWQLDGWLQGSSATRPSGGLSRLSVSPDDVVAATGRQLGFWGGQTDVTDRVTRAVARVQGLLGGDAVKVPERRGGRAPQEQVTLVAAELVDLARTHIDGPARYANSAGLTWPGSLPGPAPTRVYPRPLSATVVDQHDSVVRVDGRSQLSSIPARFSIGGGPWMNIWRWAGPWPLDERWWDAQRHRRRARFQVVGDDGCAHLLIIEGGHWWVEATYD